MVIISKFRGAPFAIVYHVFSCYWAMFNFSMLTATFYESVLKSYSFCSLCVGIDHLWCRSLIRIASKNTMIGYKYFR
jgi:hypothetical protein